MPLTAVLPSLAAGQPRGNWEALWRNLGHDHYHAGLIWNEATRAELREALQVTLLRAQGTF